MKTLVISITTMLLTLAAAHAQHGDCHGKTDSHEAVDQRGDHAMGFSHHKSTHNFVLYRDGGLISAKAGASTDTQTRDQIRAHMKEIAVKFTAGDFTAPRYIHDQIPPGVEAMKSFRNDIQYRYKELPDGGGVRVTTTNAKALAAVHSFLRFQIDDHRTGDSTSVVEESSTR